MIPIPKKPGVKLWTTVEISKTINGRIYSKIDDNFRNDQYHFQFLLNKRSDFRARVSKKI